METMNNATIGATVRQSGQDDTTERQSVKVHVVKFAPRKKALKSGAFFAKKYAEVFRKLAE